MHVLKSYKFKMDQINSKQEKEAKFEFLDAEGQLTLWSVVGSGQISNSSKQLCMSSIPARMEEQLRKSGNNIFPFISLWGFFQMLKSS